jgi:CheY-like chemotaxis protein
VAEPGGGPTLTVMLPAADRADTERSGEASGTPQPDGGTVLLVEDQEALRRLAHGILTEAGYQVLEARNGSEGLGISHDYQKPIDLLLTDVVMPGMTGTEMAARLRRDRPGMMVIFMSGYDRDLIEEPLGGMVHCLAKPFTRRGLADKVRTVLANRRALWETGVETVGER